MIELYCWLLPILFMLHDFEEIILGQSWSIKYHNVLKQSKFKPFNHFMSTAAFSIAVFIEFLLFSGITIFSYINSNYILWYLTFFVFTCHFIGHFIRVLALKNTHQDC